jgi:peptidyl-tRNA hydrolase
MSKHVLDSDLKKQNEEDQIVMYIFINNELGMNKGKIASQAAHVTGIIVDEILRSSFNNPTKESLEDYNFYDKWMKNDMYKKIVLRASKEQLLELIKTEKKCRYVIDAGLTQIPPNSLTVVGFFPRNDLREKFKTFQLL